MTGLQGRHSPDVTVLFSGPPQTQVSDKTAIPSQGAYLLEEGEQYSNNSFTAGLSGEEKPGFEAFAHFHGVNIASIYQSSPFSAAQLPITVWGMGVTCSLGSCWRTRADRVC